MTGPVAVPACIRLSATGRIVVIGANGHCLRQFIEAFIAGGGAPARLLVVRDAARCAGPLSSSVEEIAIDAADPQALLAVVGGLVDPVGCVFSWHHRIASAVIAVFAGRLLNLHGGDLPYYRGAGGGSWQVLNGQTRTTAWIHRMTRQMDRGEVLLSEVEDFGTDEPYPVHVKAAAARASERLIGRLARAIVSGDTLAPVPQDEGRALYYPRLSTLTNGWIDFSWSQEELRRFVRAFSDPYPGASLRYGEQCYRVRRADLRNEQALHPFCAGLVVNRLAGQVHVAVRDGVLALTGLHHEDGTPCDLRRFRVGGRFWTSAADLQLARCFRPSVAAAAANGDNRGRAADPAGKQ